MVIVDAGNRVKVWSDRAVGRILRLSFCIIVAWSSQMFLPAVTLAGALAPPVVVASIVPVHALLSGVVSGAAEAKLLISGQHSPHLYALKPSDQRLLHRARALFWVGRELETSLDLVLANQDSGAVKVSLLRQGGFTLRGVGGGAVDQGVDPHLWLDPDNARIMVQVMVQTMQQVDSTRAPVYAANGAALTERLDRLRQEVAERLGGPPLLPHLFMHDAYRYFIRHYLPGAPRAEVVMVHPEHPPGARRIGELRQIVADRAVKCLFVEPDSPSSLVALLSEGSGMRSIVLNPEGIGLTPGVEAYFILVRRLAEGFASCR